jgi:hypothetical protein
MHLNVVSSSRFWYTELLHFKHTERPPCFNLWRLLTVVFVCSSKAVSRSATKYVRWPLKAVSFYLGGHLGNDGNVILSPRICEQSAYADPKPTPAPNATADDRVARPLNMRTAVANPVKEPYTNRRSVKSMHKSYCSLTCDCDGPRFFAISLLMSLKAFGSVGALYSSKESTLALSVLFCKHGILSSTRRTEFRPALL